MDSEPARIADYIAAQMKVPLGFGGVMNKPPDPAQSAEYVAPRTLTVGSLFTGIGGIDLGFERAGYRVIWQAEVDAYASKVLAKHWPDVPNLGDVTKVDWSEVECPDVVAGGFPCQPVSMAGRGLAQRDERWLWPEFARCVRDLRPRHVVVENVPGLLVRGMGDVLGDLAAIGYDAEWQSIPASAVGAPHLRWRVFIVAHADGTGPQGLRPEHQLGSDQGQVPPTRSDWWATEPDVGRVADGIPRRVDRLRCLGNAVVPQVAEYVAAHIDGTGCGS